MNLQEGELAPDFQVNDVLDKPIQLSKFKGKKVFLAFLRNTHCPLCSHHVFKLCQKADYFKSLELEILVFYESEKKMFENSTFFKEIIFKDNKFSVISDPKRKIYTLYNIEVSPEKASIEALNKAGRFPEIEAAAKVGFVGDGIEEGTNPDAIPADFFIDKEGVIQYAHYGKDSGDNIELELVEAFLKEDKEFLTE